MIFLRKIHMNDYFSVFMIYTKKRTENPPVSLMIRCK